MDENRRKLLIELLKEIDPAKPYGTELFNALTRVTVSVAIEAVCLRHNTETRKIEAYLVQRSQDDTAYPGEWHCPGSVMRSGENIEGVLARLSEKEFSAPLKSARFVTNINPSQSEPEARGTFFSVVYLCVLEKKPESRGKWFSVDKLPENTVKSHLERIIPAAVGAFVANQSI